jgi:hypothetical protein
VLPNHGEMMKKNPQGKKVKENKRDYQANGKKTGNL